MGLEPDELAESAPAPAEDENAPAPAQDENALAPAEDATAASPRSEACQACGGTGKFCSECEGTGKAKKAKREALDSESEASDDQSDSDSDEDLSEHTPDTPDPNATPLETGWTFWHDKKKNDKQSTYTHMQSLRQIGSFDTVEGFFKHYIWLMSPSEFPRDRNVYCFRQGYLPMWEEFPEGGCWIIRIKRKTSMNVAWRMWEHLLLACIGEAFEMPDVVGCVLSTRIKDDAISIWNKCNRNKETRFRIGERLSELLQLDSHALIQYKDNSQSLQDFSTYRNAKNYMFEHDPDDDEGAQGRNDEVYDFEEAAPNEMMDPGMQGMWPQSMQGMQGMQGMQFAMYDQEAGAHPGNFGGYQADLPAQGRPDGEPPQSPGSALLSALAPEYCSVADARAPFLPPPEYRGEGDTRAPFLPPTEYRGEGDTRAPFLPPPEYRGEGDTRAPFLPPPEYRSEGDTRAPFLPPPEYRGDGDTRAPFLPPPEYRGDGDARAPFLPPPEHRGDGDTRAPFLPPPEHRGDGDFGDNLYQ